MTFEQTTLYQDAQKLIRLVYALEDRFPDDDAASLFRPMRDLALDVGARIAAGFSCQGDSIASALPESNRGEIRSRLAELRHYLLTAVDRHHVDEERAQAFERIYERMRGALEG